MKRVLYLLLLFTAFYSQAQADKAEALRLEKQVVNMAKQIGDPSIVKQGFYRIVAIEGENSTYKDSLAYVYFSARQYGPSFLMADEVIKRDPDHLEMLEIKAASLESLGAIDKSAEAYDQLFARSNNNFHGYNLAKLQFTLKKYEEAYKTIQEVEKLNDTGKYQITFSINANHVQQVELLAAIPYLKGLIEEELQKKPEAKISYEKALKIQPDFVFAKERLEGLQ